MVEDVLASIGTWMGHAWDWSGWPRLADLAAVATAVGTGSIALSLRASRWSRIKALERYLAEVGKKIVPGEQGLRTAEHLSRHVGIPLEDISRLAHGSPNLVSKLRQEGPDDEAQLMWAHKDYVSDKT